MSDDLKKEVQEAPLLWPLTPIPTFEEVYDPKICTEASREISTIMEGWLHPKHEMAKPEALGKVRVLECGHGGLQVSPMFAGAYLGELGANVIMVEPPGGSPLRKLAAFGRKRYMFKDNVNGDLCGGGFLHECRNKQSITLDLTKEEGREILKKLVIHADVLIENYAPGQFDEWGIGYRQLSKINPRLVYVWNGEKGQWGSLKDKPGELYPSSACSSGWCHATGLPKSFGGTPIRAGERADDIIAGNLTAHAVIAALIYRDKVAGKGQFLEVTAAEGHARIHDYAWGWYGMDGSSKPRYGNWDLAINIYSVNPCKDGYMMVGGGHDRLWYRIWKTVGKDRPELEDMILDEPTLRVVIDRVGHDQQVKTCTILTDWMKDYSREECRAKLLEEEVAAGGVTFLDEVAEEPHYKYRGMVRAIETAHYGKVLFCGSLFYGHRTPGRVKDLGRPVGYDNSDVYRKFCNFDTAKLNELYGKGLI
jgi:crotonobetainyl-CoA:carnitine CoA-transferase CaiB-like acyl-CoA transferase